MNTNLHSLFSGPLYIDAMYGLSCVPSVFKSFVSDSAHEKSTEDLIKSATSEANSTNQASDKKVVILNFKHPVVKYSYGSWLGTQSYINILESYKNDPSVAGVVFDVDSGGGQVYGTAEFYDYVKNFPKPTATYTNGYLCSAAYYFAAATDYIVANERADAIGSIGAYSTIIDSSGFYEHFGAKVHVMYGTKSTKKNAEYREVIENSNYEPYIKNQLDPIIEIFHKDMKSSRPQLNEDVFSGDTWTGSKSLDKGLIDATGTLETAISKVFSLATANTNNNVNSKRKTMSKLNVPLIEAAIGASFSEGENENGILLTDAQANALETALSDKDKAISDAETEASNQTDKITELESDQNAVTTAIQTALKDAEVEGAEKMSTVDGIAALSKLVAEYGSEDGGQTTTTFTDGEGEAFKGAATSKLQSTIENL